MRIAYKYSIRVDKNLNVDKDQTVKSSVYRVGDICPDVLVVLVHAVAVVVGGNISNCPLIIEENWYNFSHLVLRYLFDV